MKGARPTETATGAMLTMIKIYGVINREGFAIGENTKRVFLGEFTAARAMGILNNRRNFIERWSSNHLAEMVQLIFETEKTGE